MDYKKIIDEANKKNMSLPALATKIKISKTALYKSLSGESKSMKIETLEKIAEVLNVPISFFFDANAEMSYINQIESQKKGNQMNQEVMAQMTQVIDELKRKLKNIEKVTYMFIFGKELLVYKKISDHGYDVLIHLLLDFLESDHDDLARETFMNSIQSVVPPKEKDGNDSKAGIK